MVDKQKQFYIEPLDMGTNQVITMALESLNLSTDMENLPTTVDTNVKVFKIKLDLVKRLQESKNEYPVKFKVWYRDSDTARLCQWIFHTQKKKSAKYKKAVEDLAKLQAKKQQ